MSITTFILGRSGSGKSYSMHNLKGDHVVVIKVLDKPFPFRNTGIKTFATDEWQRIIAGARKAVKNGAKVIVVDDFQYILANEFMRRTAETGFQKFTDIGRQAWEILTELIKLPNDVRVYVLSHTEEGDGGVVKMKTIGKMLDEKITLEGMVTIVMRSLVVDGENYFSTRNSGYDTVKTPAGLFNDEFIPNDLAAVDSAITDYYGIAA